MAAGRTFVIDTDVLRSSGEVGEATSRPVLCARFLEAIQLAGHRVAVTDTLFDEWNRHRSRFALRWLRVMFGKKRVRFVSAEVIDWHPHLTRIFDTAGKREAVLKDRHLVETALAADRRVASLDESVRSLFRVCAAVRELDVLTTILWTNPAIVDEDAIGWVERGAPDERRRRFASPRRKR